MRQSIPCDLASRSCCTRTTCAYICASRAAAFHGVMHEVRAATEPEMDAVFAEFFRHGGGENRRAPSGAVGITRLVVFER